MKAITAKAKKPSVKSVSKQRDIIEDDDDNSSDDNQEVDVDLNLAHNILSSFKSQQGLPGPAGTLMGRFNFQPLRDFDDDNNSYSDDSNNCGKRVGSSDSHVTK